MHSSVMLRFTLLVMIVQVLSLPWKFPIRHLKSPLGLSMTTSNSEMEMQTLQPQAFLRNILSSRTNAKKKSQLLQELQSLRVADLPAANQTVYIQFLNEILKEVDRVEKNKLAMFKYPIPIPSYRIKLGALNRVLRTVLDEENLDPKASYTTWQAARRRALSIVLNQLQYVRSIRSMETEALGRLKRSSMKEMLARTPKGLETPKYRVVKHKKTWEVREYEDFSVCSTLMDENERSPIGFNSLAGYIFGKNQQQEKMAMTTPVISTQSAGNKKMSFVMPSRFWSSEEALTAAPRPLETAVRLEGKGGGLIQSSSLVAVRWFGGFASPRNVAQQSAALLASIAGDGEWEPVEPEAPPLLMQYNDPFQPPWKRRNEVAVPVRRKA